VRPKLVAHPKGKAGAGGVGTRVARGQVAAGQQLSGALGGGSPLRQAGPACRSRFELRIRAQCVDAAATRYDS